MLLSNILIENERGIILAGRQLIKLINTKACIACPPDDCTKKITDFYSTKNKNFLDGKVPWCKKCIKDKSLNEDGTINEESFQNVLRSLNLPFYRDTIQSAIDEYRHKHPDMDTTKIRKHGSEIVDIYFKNINNGKNLSTKTFADSEIDMFVYNVNKLEKHTEKDSYEYADGELGDFEVNREIKDIFGDGYSGVEYKKMYDKYNKLKMNYTLQTNIHQEALATYVRFKVKEEDATARGNVDEAKKWYDAAQNAAEKGKLTPKQLTKADLDSGVNSISELTKALEQATDVIKILPRFKYRPNDSVDFTIYCYVDYERKLNDQPSVPYEAIYSFYDKKKKEYIEQNGDPYGIFANDTTEKNRETVKTFITLPDDYDELSGEDNG